MDNTLRRLGMLLLATTLGGCLPLPYLPSASNQISRETLARIQPGSSTRVDVLLTLSDPDIRGDKDGYFIYNWQQGHGGVAFIMGGGGGAAPVAAIESNSCISVAIKFSAEGTVAAIRQFVGEPKGSGKALLGNDHPSFAGCSASVMSRDIDAWVRESTP